MPSSAESLTTNHTLVPQHERGKLGLHGAPIATYAKALKVSANAILGLKKPTENGVITARRLLRRQQKINCPSETRTEL